MAAALQERFDELAKGLATKRLSRRQVLKSFVAGALLATPLGALWNSGVAEAELPSGTTIHFNAARDFSIIQNPAGPWAAWSYGYSSSWPPGEGFTRYTNHREFPDCNGLEQWYHGASGAPRGEPAVTHNHTGRPLSCLTISQPPDMLNLHPGPNSNLRSVVRWTAPYAGTAKIEGSFVGIDTHGTTTVAYVYHNSSIPLFTYPVRYYGTTVPFSITKEVAARDTIDFSVDDGGNWYITDSTGLDARIAFSQYVPTQCGGPECTQYSAEGDFSATNNPSGAWSYGYQGHGYWFAPYTNHTVPYSGLDRWSSPLGPEPMVTHNNTGGTVSYRTIRQPPDMLNVHPGPNGEKSVVRWTAPDSGTAKIEGTFEGIDMYGTTTDVAVVLNSSTTLQSDFIHYYFYSHATVPFSITQEVAAGDAIHFIVGYGQPGHQNDYKNDSTGLAVTITLSAHVPTQCVSPECTQSANSAYSSCNSRCESLAYSLEREKCLEDCTSAFATEILNCGCLVVEYDDSTTQIGTPRPCDAECSATVLYLEARKDADYARLQNYLAAEGFVITGTPTDFISQDDGVTKASDLITAYTHPSRSGTIALLHYLVLATGERVAFVVISEDGTVSKVLISGPNGSILEDLTRPYAVDSPSSASAPSARTAGISGLSASATTGRCDSQEAVTCVNNARDDFNDANETCVVDAVLECGAGFITGLVSEATAGAIILKVVAKSLGYVCLINGIIGLLRCVFRAEDEYVKQRERTCAPLGTCAVGQVCVDGQCRLSCRNELNPADVTPLCERKGLVCCQASDSILNDTCVSPSCLSGAVFDPNTCDCKCQNTCTPPGVLDKRTCKCDCSAMNCIQPTVPNADCSDCVCPSGGPRCGTSTCCAVGQTCCGSTCCPSGQQCCNGACVDPCECSGGSKCGNVCCPTPHTICAAGKNYCCRGLPAAWTPCGNGCCAPGSFCDRNGLCCDNIVCVPGQTAFPPDTDSNARYPAL